MIKINAVWLCLPLALLTLGSPLFAADSKKASEEEKEMKEAAEEDAAATHGQFKDQTHLSGRLSLTPPKEDETPNSIVGIFQTKNATYQVKFESLELRKSLMSDNNKTLDLNGKIRNKGKYFIVQGVDRGKPPPPQLRKRGGL